MAGGRAAHPRGPTGVLPGVRLLAPSAYRKRNGARRVRRGCASTRPPAIGCNPLRGKYGSYMVSVHYFPDDR
jgi:hypothetical protein